MKRMTPQDWLQSRQGQTITVPTAKPDEAGQCWVVACALLHDVYGLPYLNAPSALAAWTKGDLEKHGWTRVTAGNPILPGDLVFYSAQVGGGNGHVSFVSNPGTISDFTAYDSNWGGSAFTKNGFPVLHKVRHNDQFNKFIIGYFRPPGGRGADVNPQKETMLQTNNDVDELYLTAYHRYPESDAVRSNWLGREWPQALDLARTAPEYLSQNHILLVAYPAAIKALQDVQAQLSDLQNKPPQVVESIKTINQCVIDTSTMPADDASMMVKVVAWLQRLISKK
jgi:hypothetical protein